MERIKQALERARQEQVRNMGAGVVHPLAPVDSPESQITYSETRVTAVSPSVLKKHRIITGTETDEVTAAYKILRTQVLQRMVSKGWNALAVTSPGPGQGKTVTAINLAISLAREVHHTVLLVDLDMRRPSIHRYLGLKAEVGISDVLTKGTPVSHALVNPGIEVSTAGVFRRYRELTPEGSEAIMLSFLSALRFRQFPPMVGNDLEDAVVEDHPEVGVARAALLGAGAVEAWMTGSGASMVGIFESAGAAVSAVEQLTDRDVWARAVETLDRASYRAALGF